MGENREHALIVGSVGSRQLCLLRGGIRRKSAANSRTDEQEADTRAAPVDGLAKQSKVRNYPKLVIVNLTDIKGKLSFLIGEACVFFIARFLFSDDVNLTTRGPDSLWTDCFFTRNSSPFSPQVADSVRFCGLLPACRRQAGREGRGMRCNNHVTPDRV